MASTKSLATEFVSNWNTEFSWAKHQGISSNAVAAVYTQDLNRIKSGYYPMSAAERTRNLLAAGYPTGKLPTGKPSYTQTSQTHRSPWSFLGNITDNLGDIVVGFIHGPDELLHMAENTIDVMDGSKDLSLSTLFNSTVLALIPGLSDLGTIIGAGSLGAGLEDLLKNPISSLLDLMPSDGIATDFLAKTDLGARMAEAAGMTLDEFKNSAMSKVALGLIANKELSPGIAARLELKAYSTAGKLGAPRTVGDASKELMMRWKHPAGPAAAELSRGASEAGQMNSDLGEFLMQPFGKAMNDLDPDQAAQVYKIYNTYVSSDSDRMQDAMDDENLTTTVKKAVEQMSRVQSWARLKALASHLLSAIWSPITNEVQVWSSAEDKEVVAARDAVRQARTRLLPELAKSKKALEATMRAAEVLADQAKQFSDALPEAKDQIPEITGNLTNEGAGTRGTAGKTVTKREQARAVFGLGGLSDQLEGFLKQGDAAFDQVESLVPEIKNRMKGWDVGSVKAEENPAFARVADVVDRMTRLIKARRKAMEAGDKLMVKSAADKLKDQAEARNNLDTIAERYTNLRRKLEDGVKARKAQLDSKETELDRQQQQFLEQAQQLNEIYRRSDSYRRLTSDAQKAEDRVMMADNESLLQTLKDEKAEMVEENRAQKAELDQALEHDKANLTAKQKLERTSLLKPFEGVLGGLLKDYYEKERAFEKALMSKPPAVWRDIYMDLYGDMLNKSEHSAEAIDLTAKHFKMEDSEIEKLRHTPRRLAEQMNIAMQAAFNDPIAPSVLIKSIKAEMAKAHEVANSEVQRLIQSGQKVPYVHSVSAAAEKETYGSFGPLIPRVTKEPLEAMARKRVFDYTPKLNDLIVSVDHSVGEILRHDSWSYLNEHYLSAHQFKDSEIDQYVHSLHAGEPLRDPSLAGGENFLNQKEAFLRDQDLVVWNPKRLTWAERMSDRGEEVYIPRAIKKTIDALNEEHNKVMDKVTGAYRYSVMGLSPRTTAHVTFGGLVMQAIREPGSLLLIGRAFKALKEGSVPGRFLHSLTEEGFERMDGIDQRNFTGAQDGHKYAVQEVLHQQTGKIWSAANVKERVKALSQVNYTFMRYVRNMQASMIYLDVLDERVGKEIEDVDNPGTTIHVTPEMAEQEAMHRIEQVYGTLRGMTPFSRAIARNIMPFWGWNQHIIKYVLTLPFDHPWRTFILSQLSEEASEQVPKDIAIRSQFLLFLTMTPLHESGKTFTDRFLDPFRTVANYASLQGWITSMNPIGGAILAHFTSSLANYGQPTLYPNTTFTQFYGIDVGSSGGNAWAPIEVFFPQVGALQALGDTTHEAKVNALYEDLGVPFLHIKTTNLRAMAAKDEEARYNQAKEVATQAFSSGTFEVLNGYRTVPDPLNPDLTISVSNLKNLYYTAKARTPLPPIETVAPPKSP